MVVNVAVSSLWLLLLWLYWCRLFLVFLLFQCCWSYWLYDCWSSVPPSGLARCRANKLCLRDRVIHHRLGSRSTACNWTVVCCPVEPLLFLCYPVRLLRLLACGTKMSWMRAKLSFVCVCVCVCNFYGFPGESMVRNALLLTLRSRCLCLSRRNFNRMCTQTAACLHLHFSTAPVVRVVVDW